MKPDINNTPLSRMEVNNFTIVWEAYLGMPRVNSTTIRTPEQVLDMAIVSWPDEYGEIDIQVEIGSGDAGEMNTLISYSRERVNGTIVGIWVYDDNGQNVTPKKPQWQTDVPWGYDEEDLKRSIAVKTT